MAVSSLKLAVLIDGDNVSADAMSDVFAQISSIGTAVIRDVYGSQSSAPSWVAAGRRHALSSARRHMYVTGHNATDIEMVIGAMDLMASGAVDGFCIVSSDRDFTSLAIRLREADKFVFGFGEKKAPASLRNACNGFYTIGEAPRKPSTQPLPKQQSPLKEAVDLLNGAYLACGGDGWVTLSNAGKHIRTHRTGFSPRNYGSAGLKKLLQKCGGFEVKQMTGQDVFRPMTASNVLKLVTP